MTKSTKDEIYEKLNLEQFDFRTAAIVISIVEDLIDKRVKKAETALLDKLLKDQIFKGCYACSCDCAELIKQELNKLKGE